MNSLKERVALYLKKAKPLFEGLESQKPGKVDIEAVTKEFEQMTLSYYSDAKHFFKEGDFAKALAALEYAEGWMDAGKVLGIFK